MKKIKGDTRKKTVILVTKRWPMAAKYKPILFLRRDMIGEQGTHATKISKRGDSARLWNAQQQLEAYGKVAVR